MWNFLAYHIRHTKIALPLAVLISLWLMAGCSRPLAAEGTPTSDGISSQQNGSQKSATESSKSTHSPIVEDGSAESPVSSEPAESVQTASPMVIHGLVNVKEIDPTLCIDLKYATTDNFTGKKVYSFTTCLLRKEAALKLSYANQLVKQHNYRIKVFDGYRPPVAQKYFWELVPDQRYVANPAKGGSIHSKGGAVDVTLIDENDQELDMPSSFDDFSAKASRKNTHMTQIQKMNLEVLTNAMVESGFAPISTEWWHFNDTDSRAFETVEINPEEFEKQ